MRFVIQVVSKASVEVEQQIVGSIGQGYLVLVGVAGDDTRQIADKMIKKLLGLRIFPDENGKTNLSLADIGGEILLVSQFTLYADCKRGNRPGFSYAGPPQMAEEMFDYIVAEVSGQVPVTQKGIFGADMKVSLVNEGPFTIILDSAEIC